MLTGLDRVLASVCSLMYTYVELAEACCDLVSVLPEPSFYRYLYRPKQACWVRR